MSIKAIAAIGLLVVLGTAPLAADIIWLKNGNRLEVEAAEVNGERVNFFVFNGRMSIDLSLVARIEKTSEPAAADAGIINGISGRPFAGGAQPSTTQLEDQPQNPDEQANEERKQLVDFYITQRVNLMKEIKFAEEQIQTIRSVIYAKSNIFSDTTEDRARLTEMEQRKRESEDKLQNLLQDARKAGLTPAELRQVEAAKPETAATDPAARPKVSTIGGPSNTRDSKVTWSDREADEDRRTSKTVLGEDPVTEEPPPDR